MNVHPRMMFSEGRGPIREVQFRIRSLAPEDRASVLKFQEHRKRCLPVVLGGLGLSKNKEKEAESYEGKTSNPEKC
jgi:hypothetical protein